GVNADGETVEYSPSSVRTIAPGVLEVWQRTAYKAIVTQSEQPAHDEAKILVRLDCSQRRLGIVSIAYYLERRLVQSTGDGSRMLSMTPIIPGSMGDGLADVVCAER